MPTFIVFVRDTKLANKTEAKGLILEIIFRMEKMR
jgi:hypothetical protein